MEDERSWAVVVHNDDVNTHIGVAYAVREVYGLPAERGLMLADEVHETGEAELTWCASREQAEETVRGLQLLGLRATVRGTSRG
ncbi:ATP-dependent Clp protease adaptor ClpS [Amycolatopsis cynarae]|uniref:ATP-dependent Clp protease adaptor ClpS n=1 Tax=Amycolatopsis cynarae TaxID=2995223 RepID=A0ABY7AXG9_9PSEU|nr:ATP-dependent Clp protease adaptor ClpS [Amycolatopsis sp. HUAS 11-8]WAL64422.1 ATP-dependent Clp protease adaptor ClpS [Amycolatopsis sp. HUAS 11-8]